jgi:tripartite ATP-independent transporter DctP family solute receptor
MTERVRSLFLAFLLIGFQAKAETVFTLAHVYAAEHPAAKACRTFASTVNERSQGRLRVEIYGDASLGDETTILKALKLGSLDLSVNSQGPTSAFVPEFNVIGLPFLFADSDAAWRVLDGPAGEELARRAALQGFIVLGLWDSGMRHFSSSVRPLLRPADFAGLTFRIPPDPVTADIVRALGGKAQEIKFSDLYGALLHKSVDGQENPLIMLQTAKLYEVQKYLSLTAHKYSTTHILMSKRVWDRLSEKEREIIRSAANEATVYQRALIRNTEKAILSDLAQRGVGLGNVDARPIVAAPAGLYAKWTAGPTGDYVRMVVRAAREKP